MRGERSALCLLVVILSLGPVPSRGQDVTLEPVEDRSATDTGPADGVFDQLEDPTNTLSVVVVPSGYTEMRSALEFNISGLTEPPGVARLFLLGGTPEGRRVEAHGYTVGANGTIELVDFARNNLQSVGAPMYSYSSIVTLDVTPIVTAAVNASGDFVGVNIRETTTGGATLPFYSTLTTFPSQRPRLEIFFLFADGFESGDVSAWSGATP